jgi:hypothetical protein
MADVEKRVYIENGTTEDQVRVATEYYAEDPDFKATLSKLKKIFNAVTGQPPDDVDLPDHITPETTIQAMSEVGFLFCLFWFGLFWRLQCNTLLSMLLIHASRGVGSYAEHNY